MNRRGFLATLSAIAAALGLKPKPPATPQDYPGSLWIRSADGQMRKWEPTSIQKLRIRKWTMSSHQS